MANARQDSRPDPDELLARVEQERQHAQRGKLKIFLGYSPGVGKTYAMLQAARRLRDEHVDVLCGIVETHGRGETAAMVQDLELLPPLEVSHRGRVLREFNLDAALARKPAVILVDELAHTNAPGARHPKRYQDVEELLAAGLNVYTTLNVQHLESLNDVVSGILGIRVWERLPDRVFDAADEVVLVDLPVEDLLRRLQEGRVYIPEQAQHAVHNFFRKGNLLALREIALRRAANRVDDQMRTYRKDHVGGRVWQADEAALCCVGAHPGEEKVVRAAARLANACVARWHTIYVETPALQRLAESHRERILRTLKLAEDLGAVTATLAAQDAPLAAAEYARAHNLSRIIVGRHSGARPWRWLRPGFTGRLIRVGPELDITSIAREASKWEKPAPASVDRVRPLGPSAYLWSLALTALATLLATPVAQRFELANVVMVFLLGTVVTAARYGRGPAALSAFLNVVAFDFFFVPPRFSFAVSDIQYLFTFGVLLVVGLVVAQLTAKLRYAARVSNYREERATNLFAMARELSAALTAEQVAQITGRYAESSFRAKVAVVLLTMDEKLVRVPAGATAEPTFDMAIAQWVFDHNEPAGIGTGTLPAAQQIYIPLKAPMRSRGVLVIEPGNARLMLIPEQRRFVETIAALVAIALERVHYVSVARDTLVRIESERLRNSILSALSHDIRTPLTALVGLADALSIKLDTGRPELRSDAVAIRDNARRTARLVDNLLQMASLETGIVKLRKDWQSFEEIVGSALKSMDDALAGHPVSINAAPDLPLINCDPVLIERVLVNLLENAVKYTPPATPINIEAGFNEDSVIISVSDRGPGIPSGQEQAIFEKFTRGQKESAIPGVGLGLAIARSIIEAHGGRISAHNLPQGGARFTFELPREQVPAVQGETVTA
jgi:two-component system sensor histidine kinase KdpD